MQIGRTTQSSVVTSICPKIFGLEELSFNETRREKTPIFSWCVSPVWFNERATLFG